MFYYFDYYYLVLVVPAILISLFAQFKVNSAYKKYAEVLSRRGRTANEITRDILDRRGLSNVKIEKTPGRLTDHFDPRTNVIRLSEAVSGDTSVASIGVAAHEAGHAMQYQDGYAPIKIRNAVLPVANIGSSLSVPLILLGILLSMPVLVDAGIILFSLVLVFQLVTLPVEFNASKRAKETLYECGILTEDELSGASKVLSAAAFTYVAAAITTAAQLLRLVLISRRRD
ncbi:MAG: zinc metallopeptidase [Clostridia bacterium]|nr:zinc metallopeptidase [Clostridia bacterium]